MASGSHEPFVTLLLPNYNNEPVLDMFFSKLIKHTEYQNYEFIVVDDGSTDRSLDILRRWEKSGQIRNMRIVEKEHHGVTRVLNDGLKLARGEYICRLEGDATVETPGWLRKMIDFAETDARIGVVVSKIAFPGGALHSAGRNIICPEGMHDRGTVIFEPVGKRTLDSNVTRVESPDKFSQISEVDAALGCCTLFKRDLAIRIGGFDENYAPVWIEDDDFSLSARKYNQKVYYFPEVTVIHHVESRLPRNITGRLSLLGRIRNTLFFKVPLEIKRPIRKITGQRFWSPWRFDLL